METCDYIIRKANKSDLVRLTEIYNQAIDAGYCIADTNHFTPEERIPWFEAHQHEKHPIFVYEIEEEVVGYTYISPDKDGSVVLGEMNCYVDFGYQSFGIAKKLIQYTIQVAKELGYTTILAFTLECNRESLALLKRYGFKEKGVLPDNVAKLGNKYYSYLRYELRL